MLHRLAHVQLLVERAVDGVAEVDLHVRDLPADPGRKRVLRERAPLVEVLGRDVSVVDAGRVDDVELGGVSRIRLLIELRDRGLDRARVAGVRDHRHVAVGGHRLQLPGSVRNLPERVAVVRAD